MDRTEIEKHASRLLHGDLGLADFVEKITASRNAEIPGATVDLDRKNRCGFPEVVYGEGKSVEDLERIFKVLLESGADVLATRVSSEKATLLEFQFDAMRYNDVARTIRIENRGRESKPPKGDVAIVTAGTTDMPVAEEARETLDWMNVSCEIIADVGVAGPQRLIAKVERLRMADAIVVVAGMEGALPSVVGGHVAVPVIGVPTSVGYGANLGGIAALLSMLNSCASNVTVVNIDAGFKAAYVAGLIARRSKQPASEHDISNFQ
ncbi:MAG: nickel pincer cofactor biosynthesis protein LarB [Pirellulales bacterium]|nr:nickel pincer cofactor biosynthesis protein LarB [Pirellulales bacterium]